MKAKTDSQSYDAFVGQYGISPGQAVGALSRHGLGIRREGDRLFIQVTGPATWPKHVLTPPVTDELEPESKDVLFETLSGVRIAFSRDARGHVTEFSGRYQGHVFHYDKISDQPPEVPDVPKPSVAITLHAKQLDACVGQYDFAPNTTYPGGMKLTISREGDRLVGQASGENVLQGAFDIYPASETNFFITVDGAQLIFIKNEEGELTTLIHRYPGSPGCEGKRLPASGR
jgi:hypothetical protein